MELKIAICDDDAAQREYLGEIVSEWARRNRCPVRLQQYPDAKAFSLTMKNRRILTFCCWMWRCRKSAARSLREE